MSHISIWTRSAEAQQDTPANRFVDHLGKLGGSQGVVIAPCEKGRLASIITVGEADVEIANGQNIVVGDLVTGNAEGFAVKSADDKGLYVLEVNQNIIKVLVR